jgi:hypothetical protein
MLESDGSLLRHVCKKQQTTTTKTKHKQTRKQKKQKKKHRKKTLNVHEVGKMHYGCDVFF